MKKILFFFTLFLTVCSINALAQFQGKITFRSYGVNVKGQSKPDGRLTAFITSDRIFIQLGDSEDRSDNKGFKGLLIRLDKKDFVYQLNDTLAASISKSSIYQFMNTMSEMASLGPDEPFPFIFKQTETTKIINGYKAVKFLPISTGKEKDKNDHAVIWMTQDININWGMLSVVMNDLKAFFKAKEVPTELIFQEGWLPVKSISYEEGKKNAYLLVTIKESDAVQEKVQVPTDITIKKMPFFLFVMKMSVMAE